LLNWKILGFDSSYSTLYSLFTRYC
jgi:hypothetical protein